MTLLQGWTGLSALARNLKTREAVPAQTFTSQQFIDYFEENWSLVAAAGRARNLRALLRTLRDSPTFEDNSKLRLKLFSRRLPAGFRFQFGNVDRDWGIGIILQVFFVSGECAFGVAELL